MATGNDPPAIRAKGFKDKPVEPPAPAAPPPSQKDARSPVRVASFTRKSTEAVPAEPVAPTPPTVEAAQPEDTRPENVAPPAEVKTAPETVAAAPPPAALKSDSTAREVIAEPPKAPVEPKPTPAANIQDVPVVQKPAAPASGMRVRFAAPAAPLESAAPSVFPLPANAPASPAPVGNAAVSPPPAPGKNYTPDNVIDRVQRRQWWKYNLSVKSGREAPSQKR
jgi:hypothetical protein